MIPAMKFASVWRAAKPMIAAAIAPEASRLVASLEMPVKPDSAIAMPISTIVAYSRRRTNRSRVAPSRESPVRSAAARAARPRKARSSSVAIANAISDRDARADPGPDVDASIRSRHGRAQ